MGIRNQQITISIFIGLLLGSCANADGSVGQVGSDFWIRTAPPADVAAFLDRQELYDLCQIWVRSGESASGGKGLFEDSTRRAIGRSLAARKADPTTCLAYEMTDRVRSK